MSQLSRSRPKGSIKSPFLEELISFEHIDVGHFASPQILKDRWFTENFSKIYMQWIGRILRARIYDLTAVCLSVKGKQDHRQSKCVMELLNLHGKSRWEQNSPAVSIHWNKTT